MTSFEPNSCGISLVLWLVRLYAPSRGLQEPGLWTSFRGVAPIVFTEAGLRLYAKV